MERCQRQERQLSEEFRLNERESAYIQPCQHFSHMFLYSRLIKRIVDVLCFSAYSHADSSVSLKGLLRCTSLPRLHRGHIDGAERAHGRRDACRSRHDLNILDCAFLEDAERRARCGRGVRGEVARCGGRHTGRARGEGRGRHLEHDDAERGIVRPQLTLDGRAAGRVVVQRQA